MATPTTVPASQTATQAELAINGGSPVSEAGVPFMSISMEQGDRDAVNRVLDSGMLRAATQCAALEEQFGQMTGAAHAMACANGTCALQLAYEPLFGPGDEVTVPAWTYIATASMIVARGATPVFCDSREDTFQIDVEDAAKRITGKTKAIACTHLYGCPVDIDAVQKLAAAHDLSVVYDSAQAHLARYDGEGVGAYGDATTYSFYATKNLGTGEGGMITCNDHTLAHDIALLRSHGETDKYLHERIGYNYRMNDLTGAIGLSKLQRLPAETDTRRAAAAMYGEALAGISAIETPTVTAKAEPVWHLYTVKLNLDTLTCDRDTFSEALKAEGVPSAVHYPRSLTRQPAFAAFVKDHPAVADSLAARVMSLPMHPGMTREHVDTVAEAIKKVASHFAR